MSQENESWNRLCDLTTALVPEFGARPAAFRAACERNPDLAKRAITPSGEPVIPGTQPTPEPEAVSPIMAAILRMFPQSEAAKS